MTSTTPTTPVFSPSPPATPSAYGPQGRSPWMDVDWRAHQHWTIINDSPVNVVELGEGPPLLFVHGLSGSWPNWLEQLPVFARTHRVIALDLPGFGRSPMPTGDISISAYARTLDALLDALDVDAVAAVGNSMGGFVSAELADQPPPARGAPRAGGRRRPQHLPRPPRPARTAPHPPALAPGRRHHQLGRSPRRHPRAPARAARRRPRPDRPPRRPAARRRSSPSRSAAVASPAFSRPCRPTSTTTSATASPRSPAPP